MVARVCECVRCYMVFEASDAGRPMGFNALYPRDGLEAGERVVRVQRRVDGMFSVSAALVTCSMCSGTGYDERSL